MSISAKTSYFGGTTKERNIYVSVNPVTNDWLASKLLDRTNLQQKDQRLMEGIIYIYICAKVQTSSVFKIESSEASGISAKLCTFLELA